MPIRVEPLEGPVGAVVHGLNNRASMHCAIDDYTEPRRMLRMIVGNTGKTGH
jgi:hypothetical protein